MRVIVVGASGMLGSALVAACKEAGFQTIGLSREQLDVTQARMVRDRLSPAEWVVNCAAFRDVQAAETQRTRAFDVNSEGARVLAVSCARRGIRLMHISCASVFDGQKNTPYTETDAPKPINILGLSKLSGEKGVRAEGGKSLIVRLPVLLGPQEGSLPSRLLAAARAGQFPLRVPAEEIVAPAYSPHVAAGLVSLLKLDVTGIVHVAAAGRCTWVEFARALVERVHPGGAVEEVPATTFYGQLRWPAQTVLDSHRFRQWTGQALPDWRAGLEAWVSATQAPAT